MVFISRQLGHASPSMTLDVYGGLFDRAEHARRAAEGLEISVGDARSLTSSGRVAAVAQIHSLHLGGCPQACLAHSNPWRKKLGMGGDLDRSGFGHHYARAEELTALPPQQRWPCGTTPRCTGMRSRRVNRRRRQSPLRCKSPGPPPDAGSWKLAGEVFTPHEAAHSSRVIHLDAGLLGAFEC